MVINAIRMLNIIMLIFVGQYRPGSAAVLRQVGPPEAALLARDDCARGQGNIEITEDNITQHNIIQYNM